jgi:hypothetical protein
MARCILRLRTLNARGTIAGVNWVLTALVLLPTSALIQCGGRTSGQPSAADAGGGADGFASGSSGAGSSGAGVTDSGMGYDAATDGNLSSADAAFSIDAMVADLDAAPAGLAAAAYIVNGVVQSALVCPSANWEFAPFPTSADSTCSSDNEHPGCPGVTSVYLVNTSAVPVAYYATNLWYPGERPGVPTGAPLEAAGVMAPGGYVDITSVFDGNTVAVLGSSLPFSSTDGGKYASDEGTVPWPNGVAGSEGASTMYVAEIEVKSACQVAGKVW